MGRTAKASSMPPRWSKKRRPAGTDKPQMLNNMNTKIAPTDLTQRPPRSFHVRLGGFVILPRMLDKGRATLVKKNANSKSMSPLLGGLAPRGQLIVAGVGGDEPIEVNPVALLFGARSIAGTMTGSSIGAEDTLSFSALQGVRPMIETIPLANAAEAYGRMMRNEARFRIVLVTGQ